MDGARATDRLEIVDVAEDPEAVLARRVGRDRGCGAVLHLRVDGASDGGEQGPARAEELLHGAAARGGGGERGRRSGRGVSCGEAHCLLLELEDSGWIEEGVEEISARASYL